MYQRQVSFSEAVSMAFNKYCCFTGRASRSEYWWFQLFAFVIGAAANILDYMIGASIVSSIVVIALFLPTLGLCWRRLHDIGKAGGWYFIGLIPVVGQILLIVWFCQNSEPTSNRFGDVPNVVYA